MKTVVLLGTLDTKGREYEYAIECLREAGVLPLMVDFGVLADPAFKPDIGAQQVAEAGGTDLSALRFAQEGTETRARALTIMTEGLVKILANLRDGARCDAVFGLGGSGGSSVIAAAMRSLPLGIPKLLVSTMASGDVRGYIGTKDMAIMYSVTDIAGLNRVSRQILRNAAFGIAGMAQGATTAEKSDRPLIAITMFGITTPCGLQVVERLEKLGFETIVFHANGSGRAMEELIDEGLIDGVMDLTPKELTDFTMGAVFHAGPDRLEAAGRKGIPQLVAPGGVEVSNWGPLETMPAKYKTPDRKVIVHNALVCAARINAEESIRMGTLLATKVNAATGPTGVIVPLGGFDKYEMPPDGPWIDRDKDAALISALHSKLRDGIAYREVEANINEPAFADEAVQAFMQLWQQRRDTRAGRK
jgi:uncharacterized protein (UPF0261 family)